MPSGVRIWMAAFVLCATSALTRGQEPDFSSHPPTYEYGEIVSLRCRGFQEIGDPDPPYTFIWTAPEGSTSLTRDTSSFVNTSASSRLTFTAFQEDSGQYTCDIVGNSIYPVPKTTITIVPAILRGPVDMTLEYRDGLTATFTCTAFGGDDAALKFDWLALDSVAGLNIDSENETTNANGTTSTITTNVLSLSDRGSEYSCQVEYVESAPGPPETAVLNIVPAIEEEDQDPRDIFVGVGLGRNATFSCTAYSGPLESGMSLIFEWSGPADVDVSNVANSEPVNNTVTSVLTLVNVTEDYEGGYNCSVAYSDEPGIKITSETATLSAIRDPPDITEPPSNMRVNNSDTATFTCTAIGNGTLNITWQLPRGEIVYIDQDMENDWTVSSSLTIMNITAEGGGNYTCIAENEAGTNTATAVLSVRLYFSGEQVDLNTTNGTSETLVCEIEGFPIYYEWEKMTDVMVVIVSVSGNCSGSDNIGSDSGSGSITSSASTSGSGSMLTSDSDSGSMATSGSGDTSIAPYCTNGSNITETRVVYAPVSTGRDLVFNPVLFGDEGVYRCVATSDVGERLISDAITVTISPEGGVTITSVGVVYDDGDDVSFTCTSEGGPDNTLQWFKDGTDVTDMIEGSENNLTLYNISADGDGGVYECRASNAAGMGSASVTLYVSPMFIMQPLDQNITDGENVSFTCIATAFPPAEYMWYRVEGDLPESATGGNTSTLTLSPAVFGDQGQYYCNATSNDILISSDIVTLTISPEGGVLITPENETFNDSNTVVLSCTTVGGPGNTFQWSFNGAEIGNETSSNLTLINVTADNGGAYTCTVTNPAGSDSYTTYVFISPMITMDPVDVEVSNGTMDVTFSCDATGFPAPTFEWLRQYGGTLPESSSGGDTSVLTIGLAVFGDEGLYYCVASSNNLTVESERATLSVAPLIANISSEGTVAEVGERFELMCSVLGGPNNMFQWLQNDNTLQGENMDTLILDNVTVQDAGVYTCRVVNAAGENTSQIEIFVAPNIVTPPQDVLAEDGDEDVRFTCIAEGVPTPSITWDFSSDGSFTDMMSSGSGTSSTSSFTSSGSAMSSGSLLPYEITTSSNATTVVSILTISTVTFSDYGYYRCVVYSSSLMLTESATAILHVAPSITFVTEDINAQRNTMHELNCTAEGGPYNMFSWKELDTNETLTYSSELTITVDSATVGGVYQCTVENMAGSDSANTTINVVQEFFQPPEDSNVTSTEELMLVCSADGSPAPSLLWTHNGTVVDAATSDRTTIADEVMGTNTTSTLRVGNTTSTDSGVYMCIAESPPFPDVNSSTALVLIQDTPEQPQNLTAFSITSRSISLRWVEPHHNNAPVTGYYVTYTDPAFLGGEMRRVNSTEEMVTVTDLHPGEEYTFIVVAVNDIGESRPSDPERAQTLEEVPSNSPQNVSAMVLSSTQIAVSWDEVPVVDRNGVITMYEVQFEPLQTFNETIYTNSVNITNTSMMYTVLMGLEEFVEYNISVRAYTSIGPGPYSTPVTNETETDNPAAAPQEVMVSAMSSTELLVEWMEVPAIDENGEITNYEIRYDPLMTFDGHISTNITNTSGPALTMVLMDLQEDVEYSISVRAYTSTGPGPFSDPVSNRTLEDEPAAPPENVSVSVLSSTQIAVSWDEVPAIDQNGVITMYEVQFEPLQTFNGTIYTNSVNITNTSMMSTVLMDLEEFVNYSISVRAYTSIGPGPYSIGIVERTDTDVPDAPPQNVMTVVLSSTSIQVSWEEVPEINRNGIITMYEVLYDPLETFDGMIYTNSVNISDPSMMYTVLMGLEEYVEYNISVRAYTSAGPGPYSTSITNRTETDNPAAAPQEVLVSAMSSTELLVEWMEVPAMDENGEITNYEIRYDPLMTFDGHISTNITNTSGPALMVVLMDLQEDVEYSISVRAYTSTGPGPFSDPVSNRTLEDEPAAPPENVSVITLLSTEIAVSWDEVPAIDQNGVITMYEVQFEPLQTFNGTIYTNSVNITNTSMMSTVLMDLEEYVEYNISVRAYTRIGPGPYSIGIVNRTNTDVPDAPPQNVMTVVLSSTSIQVSWEEVPEINRNGIITMYEVLYDPLETFDGAIYTNSVNISDPSMMSTVLMDLEEYVEYNISVRAYTSEGPGPYSDPVSNRTLEDEPASPPTNLTVGNITSTTIMLTWSEVPPIDQNGVITHYEVEYNQTTFNSTSQTLIINASTVQDEYTTNTTMEFNQTASNATSQNVTVKIITRYNIVICIIYDDTGRIIYYWYKVLLIELHEYVEYFIRIRAHTDVGPGPYSDVVNVTTEQDVPSGFPMDINATTLNSNMILVTWTGFPLIDHNGILTEYEIQYNQTVAVDSHPPSATERVPANTTEVILTGLGANVDYNVTVRARTVVGPGPYNPQFATAQTDQDVPEPPPKPPAVNETVDIVINRPPEESVVTVTIRWMTPEVTGGPLQSYDVLLVAIGEAGTDGEPRRRRQTDDFLANCIVTGVNNTFNVPVNTTQLDVTTAAFTTYEYQVRGNNELGSGDYSPPTSFTTPELVPTEPRNLLVQYESSTSLVVTWDTPLCDYGVRTNYNLSYIQINDTGALEMVILEPNVSTETLEDLEINTHYAVSICASTSVGCGPPAIVVNQTDEDIPNAVDNFVISEETPVSNRTVQFNITWEKPSDRNGSFHYILEYKGMQTGRYPPFRRQKDGPRTVKLDDGNQEIYIFENALPFAEYDITLTAVNTKLNRSGPSVNDTRRTIAIAPTAITQLRVEAENSTALYVAWQLPLYSNGPISHYVVYIRKHSGTGPLPQLDNIDSDDYDKGRVNYPGNTYTWGDLDLYTYYAVIVQAVGNGDGVDLEGLLTEDSVRVERTFADEDTPPTTDPTSTASTGRTTFTLTLPDPLEIDTGPVIFYAIIIIRITDTFNRENPPDSSAYMDAMPYSATADPPQEYYITAAWDDPKVVPDTYTVGDETETVANDVTYENGALSSNTDYAYIIRFDIMSDTDEMLVFYSDFDYFKTDERKQSNAGAIAGSVIVVIILLAASVVAVVLVCLYFRHRANKYLFEGEIATVPADMELVIPVVKNPSAVSPYSGTMEPIPLDKFKDHVERMHSNDDYLFSEEYNHIEPEHAPTSIACHLSCNIAKNRYANIVAYDHSRVKLTEDPHKEGSDYINANHINGYKQKNAFIAAQGPNPDTVADFWRMIWEQGSATIVMLTNLEEKGRVKCHQYWPDDKSGLYGRIQVHLQEILVLANYTQRTFSLQMNGSKEERIVVQYHYTVWPDHGVPDYPTSLLHFVRKVMSVSPENSGPIVVHCSAGVGRTGTFMALYIQLQRMEAEQNLDIFGCVRAMRCKRNCMVQTEPQYVFIHDALLEAIECGVTEVLARELQEQYRQLCEVDVEEKVTGIAMQYDNLDHTIHRKLRRNTGTLIVNKPKNRYGANPDTLPYDRNRCRLAAVPGVEGSDYINASFVDGYHKARAFIATQGPLPDTQDDFWKLVWQLKSATIVMLTKEKEGGKSKCHRYWPQSGAQQYEKLQVISCSTTDFPDYVQREFKLVDTQDESSHIVKQFQYTDWPEESVPASGSGLIDLIGQVQKWQRSSGDRPIIVHCSGGCGRTGTYIAVSILIERLKTEGVVDVFQTARNLRLQRPGMVKTESQLAFCYKTTLEYLESFELYDNFK